MNKWRILQTQLVSILIIYSLLGLGPANASASEILESTYSVSDNRVKQSVTPSDWQEFALKGASQLASGPHHVCAVLNSVEIWCWGRNNSGQIGDNKYTYIDTIAPVLTYSGLEVVSIDSESSTGGHTCALFVNGEIACWGLNASNQILRSKIDKQPYPFSQQIDGGVQSISAGAYHTCAVRVTGPTVCWGSNVSGQLGSGDRTTPSAGTYRTVVGLGTAISVSAGNSHTCALTRERTVYCWGSGSFGQLGNGTFSDSNLPVQVQGIDTAVQISVGGSQSCALLISGRIKCWGVNGFGQLGDGQTANAAVPVQVVGISTADQVDVSGSHACATLIDGTIQCWGSRYRYKLGDGFDSKNYMNYSAVPVKVVNISDGTFVSGGDSHSCAIAQSIIQCWGSNDYGQAGKGDFYSSPMPWPVINPKANDANSISLGESHSCAVLTSKIVKCWGKGSGGQLGNGQTAGSSPSPVKVLGIENAIQVTSGVAHTCALLENGNVKCWGNNDFGQLGDSTRDSRSVPVDVINLENVKEIQGKFNHTCAVLQNGNVQCWGQNTYGQLGDGTIYNRGTPVDVVGLENVEAITTGFGHTCAQDTFKVVKCWGLNSSGQLGTNDLVDTLTPKEVYQLHLDVTEIHAGKTITCALRSTGEVRCWGDTKVRPFTMAFISNVKTMETNGDASCAVLTNGTVKCWTKLNTYNNMPIEPDLFNVGRVFMGHSHSCAQRVITNEIRCDGNNTYGQIGNGFIFNGVVSPAEYVLKLLNIVSPQPPAILNAYSDGRRISIDYSFGYNNGFDTESNYHLRYKQSDSSVWIEAVESQSSCCYFSLVLPALEIGKTYEFQVGHANTSSISWSDGILLNITATVPEPPVISSSASGSEFISINWNTPNDGGAEITDYVVQYFKGSQGWTTFDDGISIENSATITGLRPFTNYEIRVGAVNRIGTTFSPSIWAATEAGLPDPPQVAISGVSSKTIDLAWVAPFDGGSALTDFVVEYRVSGALVWLAFDDGVSTGTIASVTGLLSSTMYEFRVGAVNSVGTTYSIVVSASTLLPNFTITSFVPSSVSKGAAVDVVGTSLSLVTEVRIGTLVVPFRFVSDALIVVTVPTNATSGVLRLISSSQNVSAGTLTVASRGTVKPSITVVEPYVASPGAVLRVQGSNIGAASVVRVAGLEAVFTVTGRNSLSLTLPLNANNGKVTVTTPGGTATSSGTVTMPPRLVTTSIEGGRGGTAVLQGGNLADVTSVSLNGVSITPSSKALTSVSFVVPSNAVSGSGYVIGPGGVSSTFTFTLLPPPVLNAFSLSVKVGDTVTLSGSNLQGVTKVLIGTVAATTMSSTATTVTFVVPTGAKTGTVTFTGAAGTVVSSSTLTVLPPPVITRMTPTSGKTGTTVTITGTGLIGATVTVGTKTATKSSNTATQIKFKIPSGLAKGTYTIKVVTANGETTRIFKVT